MHEPNHFEKLLKLKKIFKNYQETWEWFWLESPQWIGFYDNDLEKKIRPKD
jgi:hypothetical protein